MHQRRCGDEADGQALLAGRQPEGLVFGAVMRQVAGFDRLCRAFAHH